MVVEPSTFVKSKESSVKTSNLQVRTVPPMSRVQKRSDVSSRTSRRERGPRAPKKVRVHQHRLKSRNTKILTSDKGTTDSGPSTRLEDLRRE